MILSEGFRDIEYEVSYIRKRKDPTLSEPDPFVFCKAMK